MNDELKPCPFCGEIGKAHLDICGDGLYRIRCINCGIDTHTGWKEPIYPIRRWNTRPIEDALHVEINEIQHGFELQRQAFIEKANECDALRKQLEEAQSQLKQYKKWLEEEGYIFPDTPTISFEEEGE